MNTEIHIIPEEPNRWVVQIGRTKFQYFSSREQALQFGEKLTAENNEARIVVHEDEHNEFASDGDRWNDEEQMGHS